MTGSSSQGIKTVLHPVSDLATAKTGYAALLGVPPQTDESYYVSFEAAGQRIGLWNGSSFALGSSSSIALLRSRFRGILPCRYLRSAARS